VRVGHGSLSIFGHCPTFPGHTGGTVVTDRMCRATGKTRPLWRNDTEILSCPMTTADGLRVAMKKRGGRLSVLHQELAETVQLGARHVKCKGTRTAGHGAGRDGRG
jgi:hypothetical protein